MNVKWGLISCVTLGKYLAITKMAHNYAIGQKHEILHNC